MKNKPELSPKTLWDGCKHLLVSVYLHSSKLQQYFCVIKYNLMLMWARGYIAPEYHYRGEISVKSDIFSLGVLILEIVTGLKRDLNIQDISSELLIDNVSNDVII